MNAHALFRLAALLAAFLVAGSVLAEPVNKKIRVNTPAQIGSARLEVGQYRLTVDEGRVTVYKGKELLAETTGRWVEREQKPSRNALVLDAERRVLEVRFRGDRRVLVLDKP